jgi:epoxyqueuosine reductase
MKERLLEWAEKRGYRVAWGPVEVATAAASDVEARHQDGELDPDFYATELASVVAAGKRPATGTVVMVAVPRPAHRVHFELEEGPFAALLPPTYVRYRALFEEVRQDLARDGLPGARLELLMAPLKATAARLGLVRYGLNNVTYAPGLGSYIQLCGFLADAPLPAGGGAWPLEPELLEECTACGACAGECPTGAIGDERVLISAERCLTFANEMPGEWPRFVQGWAHTCLLGCLECQTVCPVNPRLKVEETGVVFSAAETRTLLADNDREDRTASGIATKMAWLGQPYAEPVMGRNLRALLQAERPGM